ncbi:MAG: hypothetical protein RL227_1617 [Pseudomonadota bacterium]|jgi:uncharacterized membrane protein
MAKSATFGMLRLGIAFSGSCLLTGRVAGAVTLLEPLVNTVAHCFFDRWWERRHKPDATARQAVGAGS